MLELAGSTGLEPATSGLTERTSVELAASWKCCNSLASQTNRVPAPSRVLFVLGGRNGVFLKARWQSAGQSPETVSSPRRLDS